MIQIQLWMLNMPLSTFVHFLGVSLDLELCLVSLPKGTVKMSHISHLCFRVNEIVSL